MDWDARLEGLLMEMERQKMSYWSSYWWFVVRCNFIKLLINKNVKIGAQSIQLPRTSMLSQVGGTRRDSIFGGLTGNG